MRKGVQVIALLAVYSVATWLLKDRPWAPPPLLTPGAAAPLLRPVAGATPPPKRSASPMPERAPLVVPTVSATAAEDSGPAPGSFAAFLDALRTLEQGKRDKVRIVHLGDSEVVGDGPTRVVRQRLGERFGLGGLGFSAPMAPVRWYQLAGWQHREGMGATMRTYPLGSPGAGRHGPGGIAYDLRHGSYAAVHIERPPSGPCELRFHYDRQPEGGRVELLVDGEPTTMIDTAGSPALLVETLRRPRCPEDLAVRTEGGYTRIYGWTVEFDRPGIVYSTVGVVGAQLRHLAHYEPDHLVASMKAHRPDLLVLGYGLNLAAMPVPPPPSYADDIAAVLADLREGLPEVACLMVGPYPVGKPEGSHPEARNAARVTEAQRDAAQTAGCAFVDRFNDAGGGATAERWRITYPRILSGDYRHLTHHGSERMGEALATTILGAVDDKPAPPALFALGEGG